MEKRGKGIVIFLIICFLLNCIFLLDNVSGEESYPIIFSNHQIPEVDKLKLIDFFEVKLYTGAVKYSYPLKVPLGTNNLQPEVSLFYNSHSTVAKAPGIVGAGWELSQNDIERDVNSTFSDTSDDAFKLSLNGNFYDLIYVPSENRYYTEIESFLHATIAK